MFKNLPALVPSPSNMAATVLSNKVLLSKTAVVFASVIAFYYSDFGTIFANALQFTTGNITNYVITIPFLSAFIIYRKRNILKATATLEKVNNHNKLRPDDVLGITLCAIAVVLYLAGSATLYALEYHIFTLPIFLAGSTMLIFNFATLRHAFVAIMLTVYLQPPPGQIVSELAADLSWMSAVIVEGLLSSVGLQITIDSSLGAPALVVQGMDGSQTPFFVGEPSSGVFSTIGLSLFAVFVAYIIRGPVWKRLTLFACGFPLFFLLNTLRIATVITLWHFWGQDVSEAYHAISGSSMVAIGTLIILLMGEKAFKLNIRTPRIASKKCSMCQKCISSNEIMCLSCGKLLGKIRQTYGKSIERMALVLFIALLSSSLVVTSTYGGASKKISDLDISQVKGPETTTYLLPNISGWNVQYAYRDNRVESILNQDAALAYRYVQTNSGGTTGSSSTKTVSLYSSVQISTGHHVWEDSLVTYPSRVGRPGATLLESRDITIGDGKEGRFLLFKRTGSSSTEGVVYWFERTPLKFGANFENRNVLISLWSNTGTLAATGAIAAPDDSAGILKLYLSLANPISKYWDAQSAKLSSSNELLFTFISKNVTVLIPLVCLPLALYWIHFMIRKSSVSSKMQKLYSQLSSQDKYILDALLRHPSGKGMLSTGSSIAKSYEILSERQLTDDQLEHVLKVVRKTGLVRDSIASVNDESILVWKPNFSLKEEEKSQRVTIIAPLRGVLKSITNRIDVPAFAHRSHSTAATTDTPSFLQVLKTIGIPGIISGSFENVDNDELVNIAKMNKIGLLFSNRAENSNYAKDLRAKHDLLIETLREISSIFSDNGLNYSVFKTIKPFPTTPSDVDILVSQQDFIFAEELLIERGYEITASDAYSSTLRKEMIVDLQLQPSVSNLPYLPKRILMENTMIRTIAGARVRTLNPEAEILVLATHSFYKEQMFTLNDFYSITMLAEEADPTKLLRMAKNANVLEVLQLTIGLCLAISNSVFNSQLKISEFGRILDAGPVSTIAAMPIKFPFSTVIKLLIVRALKDKEMRQSLIPAMKRFASPSQLAKLFSHLTRKTY